MASTTTTTTTTVSPTAPASAATESTAPAVTEPVVAAPLSLLLPKTVAARYVRNLVDKGVAIRRLRIRYVEDLEDVRAKKAEWVSHYTDVLRQLFSNGSVADACNDWVGRVYPEYADTTLFVEQFYQEMDHRCRRLRGVLRQIGEMADPVITVRSDASAAGATPAETSASAATGSSPALTADGQSTPLPPAATAATEPLSPPTPVCGILVAPAGALQDTADGVERFLEELGVALIRLPMSGGAAATNADAYEQGPDASFALLLLSADDVAALRPNESHAVCRADTAFQLGYFVGRLGAKHVCALSPGATEPFTDPHGVRCLPLDTAHGWQLQLGRYLRRAGVDVDLNRLC